MVLPMEVFISLMCLGQPGHQGSVRMRVSEESELLQRHSEKGRDMMQVCDVCARYRSGRGSSVGINSKLMLIPF